MGERDGYWPSLWPAEDGGPTRRQTLPAGHRLDGDWTATSRHEFGANMVVLRDPGEVFLQGNTMGGTDTVSWVERIHPGTLEPEVRSPDLPGGPFWAGGIAAHRNGDLYVTYGRWCHRLDPVELRPLASVELPSPRPYNSLLVLPDGHLVMKDFGGGDGLHAITDGAPGSELVVLEPDRLRIVARLSLAEGSIARLSAYPVPGAGRELRVAVVGEDTFQTVRWDGVELTPAGDRRRYRTLDGQTFGWDPVIADGAAWFLDDGEGTAGFGPSFRGKGVSTAPLHLVRVDLEHPDAPPALVEVNDQPGGIIANTPLVDVTRRIALGYDSGNGVLTAFDLPADRSAPPTVRWRRHQDHAGHLLLDEANGFALTYDYDHDAGTDHAVVVDLATGHEVSRTPTGSPVQTVLFPAPGWNDDLYVVSFTTVTRLHRP